MLVVVAVVIGIAAGIGGTLIVLRRLATSGLDAARRTRALLLEEARREADATRREAQIEAREQAVKLRADLEEELRERRDAALKIEERVLAKEEDTDRKLDELARREQGVADREVHLKELQESLKALRDEQRHELQRISRMTAGEARQRLLAESEEDIRHVLAGRVRQLEEEAATRGEAPRAQPRRRCAAARCVERGGRVDGDARRAPVRRHEGTHHRP